MKKRSIPSLATLIGASLCALAPADAFAQWIGAGAGGVGTDINDTANWTGGVITGDFSGNIESATANLSGDVTLTSLDFRWAGVLDFSLGGSGRITFSDGVYLPVTAGTITLGGGVTLDLGEITTSRTLGSAIATDSGDLVINGIIEGTASGAGEIKFDGQSVVTLNNDSNSFDSRIVISEGVLRFTSVSGINGANSALGRATSVENGVITLMRNSTLEYTGGADQTTDRIIHSMAANGGDVTLMHSGSGGVLTYQSDFDLGADSGELHLLVAKNTSTLRFEGVISAGNAADIIINNKNSINGRVVFANEANSYTGFTEINRGVLEVTKLANGGELSSIGTSSNIANNIRFGSWGNSTPVLRYVGAGDSTDRLFLLRRTAKIESSGTGALKFTNTGGLSYSSGQYERVLTLGGTHTGDNTMAIGFADPGVGSYTTRINKVDAGKWILTGANTYTGVTTVSDGILLVDGSLTSAVQVDAGIFGGGGSTTENVVIGNGSGVRDAVFAAGVGFGGFTATSGLEFDSDGELAFTFDSTLGTGGFVSASGLTIDASAFFTFNDVGDGSGVSLNDTFVVVSNTGASSIAGTFANLAEGSTFVSNGVTWQASYLGGDNNDLVLTAIAVGAIPEPGSVATIMGVIGLLGAGMVRFRRKVS